jgi:hypothetical protein
VVDDLADEYADQPVVFLEHDVDDPQGDRISRFWAAYGPGSVTLPLIMVDSGEEISYGYVAFASTYRAMVNRALARPAQARLVVDRQRLGNSYSFEVQVTNLSDTTLSSSNEASVHVIVYEDTHVADTDRFVRAATSVGITSLAPDETKTYNLTIALQDVNWSKLHSVVLVDYRPGGAYDMLQAAYQP